MSGRQINVYLGNSQRDRVIAAWKNSIADDPSINLSEIIKEYLYQVATGQTDDPTAQAVIDALRPDLAQLRAMLASGVVVAGAASPATVDEADEIARRLGAMPD
jgi:hypothetical protein